MKKLTFSRVKPFLKGDPCVSVCVCVCVCVCFWEGESSELDKRDSAKRWNIYEIVFCSILFHLIWPDSETFVL